MRLRLCAGVCRLSTCYYTGVDMTWKGIMMANLWLAGHAVVFYGGAYLVWSLVK